MQRSCEITIESTNSVVVADEPTPESSKEQAELNDAIQQVLTLALAFPHDLSKIKNLFAALLLREVDFAKAKDTVLVSIYKTDTDLGAAAEKLCALFYSLPRASTETLIKNASENLLRTSKKTLGSEPPEKKKTEKTRQGIAFDDNAIDEVLDFFENIPAYDGLYKQGKDFVLALRGLSAKQEEKNQDGHESLIIKTYELGLAVLDLVDKASVGGLIEQNLICLEGDDPDALGDLKFYLLISLSQINSLTETMLPRANEMYNRLAEFYRQQVNKTELHENNEGMLHEELTLLCQKATDVLLQNPKAARAIIKEVLRKAKYRSNEKLKDDTLFVCVLNALLINFRAVNFENPVSVHLAPAAAITQFVETSEAIIQLLRTTAADLVAKILPTHYRIMIDPPILMLMRCYALQSSLARNRQGFAKKQALLEAQRSLGLFIDFVASVVGVDQSIFKFTDELAALLDELFPARKSLEAAPLFDLACELYQSIQQELRTLGHNPIVPPAVTEEQKSQDQEIEKFLRQCEEEDKTARDAIKKKVDNEKKGRAKKKKATQREAKHEPEAERADQTLEKPLIDPKSPQGALFLKANSLIQAKQHPAALATYQEAFSVAKAAGDHVIATDAILEQASCLMGQAKLQLLKLQTTALKKEHYCASEVEEALATVYTLYQEAAAVAEQSLQYFQENMLLDIDKLDSSRQRQVEDLSLAIKLTLETAQVKLDETLAFSETMGAKAEQRLEKLAESRGLAKKRLGPYWHMNPCPQNKYRELQLQLEEYVQRSANLSKRLMAFSTCLSLALTSFRLLHPSAEAPPGLPAPSENSSENERSLVLASATPSLSFIERIKRLSGHSREVLPVTGLGSWAAEGYSIHQGKQSKKQESKESSQLINKVYSAKILACS